MRQSQAADSLQQLFDAMEVEKRAAVPVRQEAKATKSINTRGGFREFIVDLADARFTAGVPIVLEGQLFGLIYLVAGSDSTGRISAGFDAGGSVLLQPGSRIDAKASRVTLTRDVTSAASGTARFVILQEPDVRFEELVTGQSGEGVQRTQLTAGQTAVGVTTNLPTAATDGVDVTDANGIRCIVSADLGQTITGGTVVWWVFDATLGRWAESPVQETLPTGRRDVATSDSAVGARTGRAFPELRSVTVSGGALNAVAIAY